jgi:hypothetical protein
VESQSGFGLTSPFISRTFWAIKGLLWIKGKPGAGKSNATQTRASGMQAASISEKSLW